MSFDGRAASLAFGPRVYVTRTLTYTLLKYNNKLVEQLCQC
jgi:hypothetical protein